MMKSSQKWLLTRQSLTQSSLDPKKTIRIISRWDSVYENKNTPIVTSKEKQECKDETLYEKLLRSQQSDEDFRRDLASGRRIGFYKLKKDLGSGNFSKVKLAIHILTFEKVAVKMIDKNKLDNKTLKMVKREIAIIDSLAHPHLIRLYEVCETISCLHLMMEYAPGGELFAKLTNDGPYEEKIAKIIFSQIASAVEYMHSKNFLHRDLKAENVFFVSEFVVKVGDFGFATQVDFLDQKLNTFCGSPPYAAPELFQDDHYYGSSVDIWALGILLYFLLCGQMPFQGTTVSSLKTSILKGTFETPTYLSSDSIHLIQCILQHHAHQRYSLIQIQESPWLTQSLWPVSDKKYNSIPNFSSLQPPEEMEKLTMTKCEKLGISRELLAQHAERGPRSQVVGTYRVILDSYRKRGLENKSCPEEEEEEKEEFIVNGKLNRFVERRKNMKRVSSSKVCVIL